VAAELTPLHDAALGPTAHRDMASVPPNLHSPLWLRPVDNQSSKDWSLSENGRSENGRFRRMVVRRMVDFGDWSFGDIGNDDDAAADNYDYDNDFDNDFGYYDDYNNDDDFNVIMIELLY
jgi:hypothetical protein